MYVPCRRELFWIAVAALLFASRGRPAQAQTPVGHPSTTYENGTWLGYGYLCDQKYWSQVPKVASRMKSDYQIQYWFLNVGTLDATGRLKGAVSAVTNFLDAVKLWEDQQRYHFQIIAWLNADAAVVNVTDGTVRANIVDECRRLVSMHVTNSYVAGATRAFDGMQLDLEPIGQDMSEQNDLASLFDQVRVAFRALGMGDKLTSFTPSKYGTRNKWWAGPQFYYSLAGHLDLLCAMTYDTGITTGSAYQSWMEDQTTNILRAVSGRYWNNDAQHPARPNGAKVMIGLPAFPNNAYHTNTVENISYAAPGVKAGLAALRARGDISAHYFQGVAVYLLTDGTGNDGYSSYSRDWSWFRQDWLTTSQ